MYRAGLYLRTTCMIKAGIIPCCQKTMLMPEDSDHMTRATILLTLHIILAATDNTCIIASPTASTSTRIMTSTKMTIWYLFYQEPVKFC